MKSIVSVESSRHLKYRLAYHVRLQAIPTSVPHTGTPIISTLSNLARRRIPFLSSRPRCYDNNAFKDGSSGGDGGCGENAQDRYEECGEFVQYVDG